MSELRTSFTNGQFRFPLLAMTSIVLLIGSSGCGQQEVARDRAEVAHARAAADAARKQAEERSVESVASGTATKETAVATSEVANADAAPMKITASAAPVDQ